MRMPPTWLLFAFGIGLYLLAKRSGAATPPPAGAAAGGYTPVHAPTFKAEWAGADLYAQTGSVAPSGAARTLIR
jgi:hypothetical protein